MNPSTSGGGVERLRLSMEVAGTKVEMPGEYVTWEDCERVMREREEAKAMLRECLQAIRRHPWGLDTEDVEKERDGLIRSLEAFLAGGRGDHG